MSLQGSSLRGSTRDATRKTNSPEPTWFLSPFHILNARCKDPPESELPPSLTLTLTSCRVCRSFPPSVHMPRVVRRQRQLISEPGPR